MKRETLTPLMQQYFDIRAQYPDTLLLFQVGDFYELFFEDAIVASKFLAIALTKRGKCKGEDVPLCGIPVHASRFYLTKLVKGGFRVAVCNQLSEPRPGMVVDRGVTQVLTPGTLTDEEMLESNRPSYICAFFPGTDRWGVVFAELLTAQLFATTVPAGAHRSLEAELTRFFPDEVLISPNHKQPFAAHLAKLGFVVSSTEQVGSSQVYDPDTWLRAQFGSAAGEHILADPVLKSTLVLLYTYLARMAPSSLKQFHSIQFYEPDEYLFLDAATQKNLEIIQNTQDNARSGTLLAEIDRAQTAMGSRMVRKWLVRPLLQRDAIAARHEVVGELLNAPLASQGIKKALASLPDLERIVGRIALRKASQHDYLGLRNALESTPNLRHEMSVLSAPLAQTLTQKMGDQSALYELLLASLEDEEQSVRLIKRGFDHRLDELRDLVEHAEQKVLELEAREIERSGINSLKIRYNKVQGYYIEITKTHVDRVPTDYRRVQTLSNRERYTSVELTELEQEVLRAQKEIGTAEQEIYEKIRAEVDATLPELRRLAHALAYLDALLSFSLVAAENDYVLPQFHDGRDIVIEKGRHPVVERHRETPFVANDTHLDERQSLWVITGPNMGGKSTYLRQVALISILAQAGSFVPAARVQLPYIDRIFTRIGSGDNVAAGKSTFLVEMEETALICTQATEKSLVILDEVGRGTATSDGLALAQAIIEYLYTTVKGRCLFATHYHELTSLASEHAGIANYHLASSRRDGTILFLHQIAPGISPGSFGIEVAILAGLPESIVKRARQLLEGAPSTHVIPNQASQLSDIR